MDQQITKELEHMRKRAEHKVIETVRKHALLPCQNTLILIPIQKNLVEEICRLYIVDIDIDARYIEAIRTGAFGGSVLRRIIDAILRKPRATPYPEICHETEAIGRAFIRVCEAYKMGKVAASDITSSRGIRLIKKELTIIQKSL